MSTPEPRPALSRAADADVHPVSGKPLAPPSNARPSSQHQGTTPRLGKGSTSDSLRGPAKDKLVDLGVRVPKSVRKRLKAEAKARKVTPDEIVTLILDAALDERR